MTEGYVNGPLRSLPFASLTGSQKRALVWLCLPTAVAMLSGMFWLDAWLGRHGGSMLDLQDADADTARQIVGEADLCDPSTSWCSGRWRGALHLLFDYPFLISYSVLLALGIGAYSAGLARDGLPKTARAVSLTAWLPFVVATLDSVENASLAAVVAGRFETYAPISREFARAKWTAVVVMVVVFAVAVFAGPGDHRRSDPQSGGL